MVKISQPTVFKKYKKSVNMSPEVCQKIRSSNTERAHVASFSGPTQLSITCRTEFFVRSREEPGNEASAHVCTCECTCAYFPFSQLVLSCTLPLSSLHLAFHRLQNMWTNLDRPWNKDKPYLELRVFTRNLLPHCNKVLGGFVHNLYQFGDLVQLARYPL